MAVTVTPDQTNPPTDSRAEDVRRGARRAALIGMVTWPTFALLDAYMAFVAYPGAPFGRLLAYRLAVQPLWVAAFYAARRNAHRPWLAMPLNDTAFVLSGVTIALMALDLGGLLSPYMHGISIVMLVRAAVLPQPWRRTLPLFALIGSAFPLVMAFAGMASPVARAAWGDGESLIHFVANYVFVFASALMAVISSNATWVARQQVYRARRLGRYRLQAQVGQGGMGEVWLAWDTQLERNVALKLLRVSGAVGQEQVRRFEREAHAASQLREPHTIQIFDFGASDDGIYYLAMEYLAGLDLDTLVRRYGPLPPARAIRFGLHACASLEEAHAAGIIHRDIKPHNLFVTQTGADHDFVKLLDFGVARLRSVAPTDRHLTRSGFMIGTPAYLAPELWQGGEADERSDIYALGVTLYFLLTGSVPYRGTEAQVMMEHMAREPERPSARRGSAIPRDVEAIVLRCMAKRPEDRYQSVSALRQALHAVADPSAWTAADADAFWRSVGPAAP